jgi:hypothetical protein
VLILGNDAVGSDERNAKKSSDDGSYLTGDTRKKKKILKISRDQPKAKSKNLDPTMSTENSRLDVT